MSFKYVCNELKTLIFILSYIYVLISLDFKIHWYSTLYILKVSKQMKTYVTKC